MRTPDYKQLRGFCRVMAVGNLTKAAQSLNVSESALSRQIAMLEDALNLKLFSREKRMLAPTAAAKLFLQEAERVLVGLEQLPEIAQELAADARSRFRVVVVPRLADALAVPSAVAFRKAHPEVDVSIQIEGYRHFERWVIGRQFDLALGPLPTRHPAIVAEPVAAVPMVAVVSRTHRLAKRETVTIDDLEKEPLVAASSGILLRQQIENLFLSAGKRFVPSIEVSDTRLAVLTAAEGDSVSITDPFAAASYCERVCLLPIEPRVTLRFGLLLPRENPNRFVDEYAAVVRGVASDFVSEQGLAV